MHDLIIVGGGSSALSATSYALSKQLDVKLIYEKLGGKAYQHFTTRDDETNYLVGHILVNMAFPNDRPVGEAQFAAEEAVHLFERQIKARSGMALRDKVQKVTQTNGIFNVETLRNGTHQAQAVIVATGVMPRMLDVPGAQQYVGTGIGYSATTWARAVDGKRVVVIGGTTRALRGTAEVALTAERVFLVVPDGLDTELPLVDQIKRMPTVEVLDHHRVVEVRGGSAVEQVIVEHEGTFRPLNVDAAFVDLGLIPNSDAVRDLAQTTAGGFIWVDDRNSTNVPGLFAAGDVTTAFGEQALIAIGEGARAALGAYDFLLGKLLERSYDAAD